jgi:hypothetical protein
VSRKGRRMMALRCSARVIAKDKMGAFRFKRTSEDNFVLCGKPAIATIDGETRCAEHLFHGPRQAGKSIYLAAKPEEVEKETPVMSLRCSARVLVKDKKGAFRYKRTPEDNFVLCGKSAVAIIDGETRCTEHLFHGPRLAGKSVFLDE